MKNTIFRFQEIDNEIRRIIRLEIAEEKTIAAKARFIEIQEVKTGRKRCLLKALNYTMVEGLVEMKRTIRNCETVIGELLMQIIGETVERESQSRGEQDLA